MTSPTDYALLANAVYQDIRSEKNAPVLPTGWTRLNPTLFGLTDHPDSRGFSAAVFQNGSQIVISYEGTNPDVFSEDGIRDWKANIALFLGKPANQLESAALLYARVKAAYPDPDVDISFTGHSLGGGLAGLMAVYFGRPATVFDPAPFQSAASAANAQTLKTLLTQAGFADTAAAMDALITSFGSTFAQRESHVDGYYLNGEILNLLRTEGNNIATWPLNLVDVGNTDLSGVGRHSQQLMIAAKASDALRTASADLPSLLPLMADESLYAQPLKSNEQKDFLQRLLEFQFGTPLATANDMLNRFATDADKIAKDGVLGIQAVRDAAIVSNIEYYNFGAESDLSPFIETVTGGIKLDLGRITVAPGNLMLGRERLANYVEAANYELAWRPADLNSKNV